MLDLSLSKLISAGLLVGFAQLSACTLITDVDRSQIERGGPDPSGDDAGDPDPTPSLDAAMPVSDAAAPESDAAAPGDAAADGGAEPLPDAAVEADAATPTDAATGTDAAAPLTDAGDAG